jgi:hypothetical protein
MQIKHYTILEGADITAIQAWAADPNHRCIIITQNTVTRSLSVSKPEGPDHEHVFTETESALAGMIEETPEPE